MSFYFVFPLDDVMGTSRFLLRSPDQGFSEVGDQDDDLLDDLITAAPTHIKCNLSPSSFDPGRLRSDPFEKLFLSSFPPSPSLAEISILRC